MNITSIIEYQLVHHLGSILILLLIFAIAYTISRTSILRRLYLPVTLVAGVIILLAGPGVLGQVYPSWGDQMRDFYQTWSALPAILINIVFASLFIGQPVLGLKKMWHKASRQVTFSQLAAWGQFVVGGLVTLLILIPLFGSSPLMATLTEIAFQGGHGTVAGLVPVFNDYGFFAARDLGNGIATLSIISVLVIGVIMVNWGWHKGYIKKERHIIGRKKQSFYHYTLLNQIQLKVEEAQERNLTVKKVMKQIILIAIAVGIGFSIRATLVTIENLAWGQAGIKVFGYLPSFTLCIFGSIIVNWVCHKFNIRYSLTANSVISTLVLGVLIMTAIGTMSLDFFSDPNLAASFWILFAAGAIWLVFLMLFVARKLFIRHWFTNGIINFGQAMGMTATGLLFAQMVDPKNRTGAVDAFGYNKMITGPIMGGGIVTAMAIPLVANIGLLPFTIMCAGVMVVWLLIWRFIPR